MRLLQPLQDQAADAYFRFLRVDVADLENLLGVVIAIGGPQPIAARSTLGASI
jgi:hypothetical protein